MDLETPSSRVNEGTVDVHTKCASIIVNCFLCSGLGEPPKSDLETSNPNLNPLIFYIPGDQVGLLVGRDGKNIQEVQDETNTSIKVPPKRKNADISENVPVAIVGSEENKKKALLLMLQNLKQRIEKRISTSETIVIPNSKLAGLVIGKSGSNRRMVEQMSGAKLRIDNPEAGSLEKERKCVIRGTAEQIEEAKELVKLAMKGVDISKAVEVVSIFQKLVRYFQDRGFRFPEV